MGTAPRWCRVAELLLLSACVLVSASFRPAEQAESVHECCSIPYQEPETRIIERRIYQPGGDISAPGCLLWVLGAFVAGAIVGSLGRKVPKLPDIEKAIKDAIAERKRQADVHSLPDLDKVLDETEAEAITRVNAIWPK